MTEQPPKELIAWLDEIREKGIMPSKNVSKSLWIKAFREDGTSKDFRCMDTYQQEENARQLWETGRWTRIEISGVQRYPIVEE